MMRKEATSCLSLSSEPGTSAGELDATTGEITNAVRTAKVRIRMKDGRKHGQPKGEGK